MLLCPICSSKALTLDTRSIEKGTSIRRRRECINPACKKRFTTYEDYAPGTKEFLHSRKNDGMSPVSKEIDALAQSILDNAGMRHEKSDIEYSVDSILDVEKRRLENGQ
jgi:transcriptional regulator NrdR family protein